MGLPDDVLIASQHVSAMLKNKEGVETVMLELSKAKLGKVSRLFRRTVKQKKLSARKNLERLSRSHIHPYLKRLTAALASEDKVETHVHDLAKLVISDRGMATASLKRRIDSVTNWLLLVPFVTLLLPVIAVYNNTLADIPQDAGISIAAVPGVLQTWMLIIAAGVIVFILLALMIRK